MFVVFVPVVDPVAFLSLVQFAAVTDQPVAPQVTVAVPAHCVAFTVLVSHRFPVGITPTH